MLNFTEKAIIKLKQMADADNISPYSVRVLIKGGGCAGFVYDMRFDNDPAENDEIISQDGVQIIVDPLSLTYVEATVIDYVDSVVSSGFKFDNPKAVSSCGCGSSFTVY